MAEQTFTAAIRIRGVNPYIAISASRAKALKSGWRRPLPVLVRIGGIPRNPWRTNLMPTGDGGFYLYLHGQMRRASSCGVGNRVEVELRVDRHYSGGPMHPMPAWFRDPLNISPAALRSWGNLVPSRQKEILRYFATLKSEAARTRNVDRAMRVLSGQSGRFMARDWKNGR
jgi:uncharacterized protein DUF1905/bacteriocin resistance YdeI/OmpD-like protein